MLLDIRYDPKNSRITKWIKDGKECKPVREVYYPKIYISGKPELLPLIASLPGVKYTCFEEKRTWLGSEPEKIISAAIELNSVYETASMLEAKGCSLYNIDLDPVRQYLLEHSLFPMAKLNGDTSDDSQYALDYEVPELTSMQLSVMPATDKAIITINEPIGRITLGDIVIEGRSESEMISELNSEIIQANPDLILTDKGDNFELPYLHHRASLHGIELRLGREKDILPEGKGRSYFSYGRILYKPRGYLLAGRLHIDKSSFLFREGGLLGLIDLSRITGIPLQELSRLSPGSAVTALQVNQALRDGVLVPWKRNLAEYWKTAEELLIADRGALVIEPKVGLHENAFEIDFASLFPNIMVNHNISPETVLCTCCPDSEKRVPFTHYNICQQHIGLIPRVLKPLIERRMTYKKRIVEDPSRAEEYEMKQSILKWLLVTSFGYMGFNKARFGRIECHESITAYGRDILLRTIELADGMGFEILHGIVDSLWVKGRDPEKLCKTVTKEIGISLELKGEFRWIVFLPNKSNGTGALNRYYGVMTNDKLKVRGIETRRSDTPGLIRDLQGSMLGKLAEAKTASEFYMKIPEAIEVLREYTRKVLDNKCDLYDLIFETHVSRGCDEYRQFNNQMAAMKQLGQEGIETLPGQSIQYIITNHKSRNYQDRVIIPELADENTQYDRMKYYEYLLRAAESILLPFGYTEERLDGIMRGKMQRSLCGY
ncbi:MAG TPA: DNA polymerase domain-containing protein [Candidatus Methylomirabilis sp.]|nr:DNA polymerase domain-containing protein [Candidatus Methylomirabilis sp.]